MLIGDIPARNAGLYPDKAAVIQDNMRITYAQFDERINRLANAILGLRSTKGDRIAVLHHNCYQYIEIYFALAKAGMPVVPLNYRHNPSEILHVIRDSGAKIVLFGKEYMSIVDMIKQEIPSVEHFICIDAHLSGMKNYEEIISGASNREPVLSIDEEDIAILGYTGGTTGRPKGVMTTHRNIITSCYNTALERLLTPNDILLNVHPIFHAGGANSMFAFFFVGATNVILNTSRIDIDVILKAIQNYKINHLLLVPTLPGGCAPGCLPQPRKNEITMTHPMKMVVVPESVSAKMAIIMAKMPMASQSSKGLLPVNTVRDGICNLMISAGILKPISPLDLRDGRKEIMQRQIFTKL